MNIPTEQKQAYTSQSRWNVERPRVLVACCSDGRLQEAIDEFLNNHLGIAAYDRFYVAGGPGALTPGGYEFLRATQYRDDLAFLVRVHKVEELLLIFHGAASDGPAEATCAYYRRILPGGTPETIRDQQIADLRDVRMFVDNLRLAVRIRAYRAEVMANRQVRFVPMDPV